MKIYCILFDTCPQNKEIENALDRKDLHYSNYLTNSFTTTSLVSLFSGKTPSEMYPKGIGYYGTYRLLLNPEEKISWNEKMIFNQLPEDWSIHLHGDVNNHSFIPDECCGIGREYKEYIHTPYEDELDFVEQMQELPSDENHFIVLKFNHYHDAVANNTSYSKAISKFTEIIDAIDFEEEESLFWLFSDHGEPPKIDSLMSPPHAWLTWVSVTDNITKTKVTKNTIYVLDFYNTVMNRIHNSNLPNDVLHEFNYDDIYVMEDGRFHIDDKFSSCISSIKCLGKGKYLQFAYNRKQHIYRSIIYDNDLKEITITPMDKSLIAHVSKEGSIWSWYFND